MDSQKAIQVQLRTWGLENVYCIVHDFSKFILIRVEFDTLMRRLKSIWLRMFPQS